MPTIVHSRNKDATLFDPPADDTDVPGFIPEPITLDTGPYIPAYVYPSVRSDWLAAYRRLQAERPHAQPRQLADAATAALIAADARGGGR